MAVVLLVSSLAVAASLSLPAQAHEISPAIADLSEEAGALSLSVQLNMEAILAGIDQTEYANTNAAPQAARYDSLRAMSPEALGEQARANWPRIEALFDLRVDGERVPLALGALEVVPNDLIELPRETKVTLTASLPEGTRSITFGWDKSLGALVLRQQGVDDPYTGFLEAGAQSEPITLSGGGARRGIWAFFDYIPVGYTHILPKGLDHILFVLGLFLLSTHWRPLLWQVTSFTVAHTITLALAATGTVSVPASIVEPLIAASITFVAVENIFSTNLHRWRIFVVFGFGLLHGLGFASVLSEWGLPQDAFVPALLGFNVGVELGQLTVIAAAYATVGYWFGNKSWYHRVITVPASAAIALIGAWWVVERVFL